MELRVRQIWYNPPGHPVGEGHNVEFISRCGQRWWARSGADRLPLIGDTLSTAPGDAFPAPTLLLRFGFRDIVSGDRPADAELADTWPEDTVRVVADATPLDQVSARLGGIVEQLDAALERLGGAPPLATSPTTIATLVADVATAVDENADPIDGQGPSVTGRTVDPRSAPDFVRVYGRGRGVLGDIIQTPIVAVDFQNLAAGVAALQAAASPAAPGIDYSEGIDDSDLAHLDIDYDGSPATRLGQAVDPQEAASRTVGHRSALERIEFGNGRPGAPISAGALVSRGAYTIEPTEFELANGSRILFPPEPDKPDDHQVGRHRSVGM